MYELLIEQTKSSLSKPKAICPQCLKENTWLNQNNYDLHTVNSQINPHLKLWMHNDEWKHKKHLIIVVITVNKLCRMWHTKQNIKIYKLSYTLEWIEFAWIHPHSTTPNLTSYHTTPYKLPISRKKNWNKMRKSKKHTFAWLLVLFRKKPAIVSQSVSQAASQAAS